MVMLMASALGLVAAGCGGGASQAGTPAPDHAGPPPINVAETWPDQFCRATVGMTREQIRGLMGEPTEDYTRQNAPEGLDPQMVWDAYEYHFTAFFNADDKVRQLDIDDVELSPEQKAALHCATTRAQQ
jgi:hypothetical protein